MGRSGSGTDRFYLPHPNQPTLIRVYLKARTDDPRTRVDPPIQLLSLLDYSGSGRVKQFCPVVVHLMHFLHLVHTPYRVGSFFVLLWCIWCWCWFWYTAFHLFGVWLATIWTKYKCPQEQTYRCIHRFSAKLCIERLNQVMIKF